MKEDNISRLGDYDAPFCEQQYTHGSCYISLFKFKSFDQFNTPQTASNFKHLLSCGTIESLKAKNGRFLYRFGGKNQFLSYESDLFYRCIQYPKNSLHLSWEVCDIIKIPHFSVKYTITLTCRNSLIR